MKQSNGSVKVDERGKDFHGLHGDQVQERTKRQTIPKDPNRLWPKDPDVIPWYFGPTYDLGKY